MNQLNRAITQLIQYWQQQALLPHTVTLPETTADCLPILKHIKTILQQRYPNTKPRKITHSVHYANDFEDSALKPIAFLLDDIEHYLTQNQQLNHEQTVNFFNNTITQPTFTITPLSLVLIMIHSLMPPKSQIIN